MHCLECGNCQKNESLFYCTAKNDFVIIESQQKIKERSEEPWRKGSRTYEQHRRQQRKEKIS